MAKLILFENPIPYKWVKESFQKVIDEYLPITKFKMEGESTAWKQYLNYFINHKGPYITDRVSNVYYNEIPTYLELIAIPNRPFLHLYDGMDRVQLNVRIFDEYPIKGIFIVPEMKDTNQDSSKSYPNEEGLVKFIKMTVDTRYALENGKKLLMFD